MFELYEKWGDETGKMPEQLANHPFILQAAINVRPEAFDPIFPPEPNAE